MSGDLPDSEEELDLGLLDESDDDNMEVVEEVSASTSKLQKILLQEKMKQSGGFGEPSVPKKRLRVMPPDKSPERKTLLAEELFARSRGADTDRWLGFTVQEGLAARQQLGQLQVWLGCNQPSLVQRSSGVGWIAVKRGDRDRRVKSVQAKAEWDGLRGERTMETVNELAVKYGDTGGKWLFHVKSSQVDKSWQKLALAMLSGGLGPSVSMVKVSPRDEMDDAHVIIVYNDDYRDTTQVMRVENLLRSAGVPGELLYKPDIFSTLGIYKNNVWGFRPTIYSSTMMDSQGRSLVIQAGTGKSYINSSRGLEREDDSEAILLTTKHLKRKPRSITEITPAAPKLFKFGVHRSTQSKEDQEISQLEAKIAEKKIEMLRQKIEMLREMQRERLAAGPGMSSQLQPMSGRGDGNIKDRLGPRGSQRNVPQRVQSQPWISGQPPDVSNSGEKRQFAGFGRTAQNRTQNWSSGGTVEEFKRKFANFAQKAHNQPQSRGGAPSGVKPQFARFSPKTQTPAIEKKETESKSVHRNHDLPAELVLTEITEKGPRATANAENVNNNNKVVTTEKKKFEEEEEEEEDLDRYENGDEFIFE